MRLHSKTSSPQPSPFGKERGQVIILADDLTGAAELGMVVGEHTGEDTSLIVGAWSRVRAPENQIRVDTRPTPTKAQPIVFNLGMRDVDRAQEAYDGVAAFCDDVDLSDIPYLKVDSTWRGYPVAMSLALADAVNAPFILLCPAYPTMGRTISHNRLFLDNHPLHKTGVANDPQHPATHHIASKRVYAELAALSRSNTCVRCVEPDLEALEKAFTDANARYTSIGERTIFVPSCRTQNDLESIAKSLHDWKEHSVAWPVIAGSAGLAKALYPSISAPSPQGAEGTVLLISGSLNSTTLKQIEHLSFEAPHIPVLNIGAKLLSDPNDWRRLLLESMQDLLSKHPLTDTLVLCGGETARIVLEELGITTLQYNHSLNTISALWSQSDNLFAPRHIILKSGNMGDNHFLVNLLF